MTASEALPEAIASSTTELLVELCRISSASGDTDGLRAMASALAVAMGARGLDCEVQETPGSEGELQPLLLARGRRSGGRHLLLVGHLDTVLPAVEPRREGGRLHGTGALDMKGGLAALLGALDLLALRGQPAPADMLVAVVPDEEVAGTISARTMRELGADARAVLVLEPGEGRGEAETLVAGRRGLREWHLTVDGRSSHSGLAYWQGRSALVAAAEWCLEAHRLSCPGRGPTVNVARLVAGAADFVAHLPERGEILGTSRQTNVVPDRARADGEVRYLRRSDLDEVLARLAEITARTAAAHEVRAELGEGQAVPPVDPGGPGRPLVERTVALAAARGWRIEVEEDRGGISFPNFLPHPETVPVLDGLGPVGAGMHTREEVLDLRSLHRRVVLLADLLGTL